MEKFDGIKKRFGFGCMRLPTRAGLMDIKQFSRMTDRFLEAGFNYFDTARGYMLGRSEGAVRKALTSRYPRDAFVLTDKLSSHCFKKESDIPKILEAQLKDCGVDYFDFYLMHAQNAGNRRVDDGLRHFPALNQRSQFAIRIASRRFQVDTCRDGLQGGFFLVVCCPVEIVQHTDCAVI